MYIKKIYLVITAVVFLFSSLNLSAQTIHAIVCGGTYIPDIGDGCKASVELVMDALEVVVDQSEMQLKTYVLVGNDFTKNKIQSTINNLEVGKDDVIWFYSTSHGFNYKDNISNYTFIMAHPDQPEGFDQLDKYGLSLEKEIYNVLLKKEARLTITMAEACNNILDAYSPERYKAMTPAVKRNIKALFKEAKGSVISCSSKLGQYSFTNMEKGGFYTNMFLEALNDVVIASDVANWEKLMELTRQKTKGYAQARNKKQEPNSQVIIDTGLEWPPKSKTDKNKTDKSKTYFKSNIKQY